MNEAYLDAAAAAVGLPIPDECRPGVLRYLQLVAGLAPRVMDFPLQTPDEAATVFVPLAPEDLPDDGTGAGVAA
jgi:Protein of unknown function (DUF4089)